MLRRTKTLADLTTQPRRGCDAKVKTLSETISTLSNSPNGLGHHLNRGVVWVCLQSSQEDILWYTDRTVLQGASLLEGMPSNEQLLSALNTQPGQPITRDQLSQDAKVCFLRLVVTGNPKP